MLEIKKIINNKKGSAMILMMIVLVIGVMFMTLLIDIGAAYANKAQVQHINDAATLAGTDAGMYAYYSVADDEKKAVVKEGPAIAAAYSIIKENKKLLPNNTQITGYEFNPPSSQHGSPLEQFYSGRFTVTMRAESNTILSKDFSIIKYNTLSTGKVSPK